MTFQHCTVTYLPDQNALEQFASIYNKQHIEAITINSAVSPVLQLLWNILLGVFFTRSVKGATRRKKILILPRYWSSI